MHKMLLLLVLLFSSCSGSKTDLNPIRNAFAKGNYEEVIKTCTDEMKISDPKDALFKRLLEYRVSAFMHVSNYTSAIDDYQALISLDTLNTNYYSGLSYAYMAQGDSINSLIILQKAYAINPNDVLIVSNLSYEYGQAGKYEESVQLATKGLLNNPDDQTKALLLNNRGYGLLGLKQFDKALTDIEASIGYNSENSYAYYYRALVHIAQNKLVSVCADLEKAKLLGGINLTAELLLKYCKK